MYAITLQIIDKFGELREITNSRNDYFLNTSFISEFERSEYEELGPQFKLEKLEKEEQPIRNYMCGFSSFGLQFPCISCFCLSFLSLRIASSSLTCA